MAIMLTGMGATLAYDELNRVTSATPISGGTEYYGYAADGKRVFRHPASTPDEFTAYGARGVEAGNVFLV